MTIGTRRSGVALFTVCLSVARWAAAAAGGDADTPAALLARSGVKGGLVVHVGEAGSERLAELRVNERFLVQGLLGDDAAVQAARRRLSERGLGGAVSVLRWRGGPLPYADGMVNVLVAEPGVEVAESEVLRVLAPGGVACLGSGQSWQLLKKPWPETIDQWTHFLHGPDNNAVAADKEVGPPHYLQWTAGPRWARSHDHLGSVSAAVSAAGRLFYIIDEGSVASVKEPARWRLVARDAFNGVLLWKRPIGPWEGHLRPFRSGPAELPRRLVAVGQRVFVTLGYGQPVTALDAATGQTVRTYAGTENTQEILIDGDRLLVVAGPPRIRQPNVPVPDLPEWLRPYPQWVYKLPARRIVCLDRASGKVLWERSDAQTANLLPLTLAAGLGRIFFHNEKGLVALDARSGKTVWTAERPISLRRYAWSSPTVVVKDGVVLSADRTSEEKMDLGGKGDRTPRWLVSAGHDLFGGQIMAFSAATGQRLWTAPCHEGFNTPVELFVVRGRVWSGQVAWPPQPGITKVYDLKTGKVVARRPPDQKFGRFGHHRCYRAKATVNFILHSRRGIEFVDLNSDRLLVDPWVRGTCQYGILPCNGMIYTPPHSCACIVTHQLSGFNALKARRERAMGQAPGPLQRGPAYGRVGRPAQQPGPPDEPGGDWPTYRHDAARSGATGSALPARLQPRWQQRLGGPLTQVVVAAGRLFVAQPRQHTVLALDAATGRILWRYRAGGRVDSPPTVFGPCAYFGSADGWVYCLRVADGELVWRFRAAPEPRQIVSCDQLESVWPVHGSVLVRRDRASGGQATVYFVAGRSTYLDGGLFFYGLDAATGAVRVQRRFFCPSPGPSNESRAKAAGQDAVALNVLPDVLSSDGSSLYLRHARLDLTGRPQSPNRNHLFSPAGFLDASWWHRTYWLIGRMMRSGFGGWIQEGNRRVSGRLLVLGHQRVFGYGRQRYEKSGSHLGLRAEYRLFAVDRTAAFSIKEPKRRRASQDQQAGPEYLWTRTTPFLVRAMVLAGQTLVVAGPAEVADLSAARPRGPAKLWTLSASDGRRLAEQELPAPPVFDSMAAAAGRLYLSTTDGQVICYHARP